MSTVLPTWRFRAQRSSCVAVFACAGFSLGVVGRTPAYGVVSRLLPVGSPAWEWIGGIVLMHDHEIGRALLVLGTALGLLAGILVVRTFSPRAIPRSAFVLGTLCFCVPWILFQDFKLLALPAWIGALVIHSGHLRRRVGARRVAAAWVVFAFVTFAPLDVSLANYPGSPRFVPVECGGDYSMEGFREAQEGKFFLDGLAGRCAWFTRGTWILLW